jgi:hypothetical protein
MKMEVETDTTNSEITTRISLINIPEGGRARFQQRLLPQTKFVKLSPQTLLWDTAKNILTIITVEYPPIDTFKFSFLCHADTLTDAIVWGEAALMYENKNGEVKKITSSEKKYIIRQSSTMATDRLIKGMYYIQISASKTRQNKEDIAKVIHLQKEDIILEEKADTYYKYFVVHFSTKEQANAQLSYYKKYVSDAFVMNYK